MSIVFLFLGCFLLYGKSIYFPEHLKKIGSIIKNKKQIATIIGYLFFFASFILLQNQFGLGTGFILFILTIVFAYSILLTVLTIHKNYVYFIAVLSLLLIILEI